MRERGALLPENDEAQRAVTHLRGKLDRLREMRLEGEYTKEEYRVKKAQILWDLQEWERQAGSPGHSVEHAMLDLDNMAEVVRHGPPKAQKRRFRHSSSALR